MKLIKLLILSCILSLAFLACNKTKKPTACFNVSKSTVKLGDSIYMFSCSENFAFSQWIVTEMWPATLYSDNKHHLAFLPTDTGNFSVLLQVTNYERKDTSRLTKSFTVVP